MENYRDDMQPDQERYAAAERREAFYRENQDNMNNRIPDDTYTNNQTYERRSYLDQPGYTQNRYPENVYGENRYGQDLYRQGHNHTGGFAIAALVLGIVSIVFFWFPPISMLSSIVGIILAVVALSKRQSRGMSVAGMITSIVGGILAIVAVAVVLFMFAAMDSHDSFSTDDEPYFSPYPYADEQEDNPFDDFEEFFDNLQ